LTARLTLQFKDCKSILLKEAKELSIKKLDINAVNIKQNGQQKRFLSFNTVFFIFKV
jgi:hypothetical protein